jgi:hypothetical protein
MEKKVIHEVKLSKPLMVVAIIAAFGLLAIGLRPVIEATPAFAQSNQVHKIAICNPSGNACAGIYSNVHGKYPVLGTRDIR